ncbi:MAG: hypothetical protein KC422_14020 [Trueperaceae bacterium]|nr:hypothetical protein [Trueperaceae bacterium]
MILVTYASRYGGTKQIANYLAKVLELEGLKTQLKQVDDVVSIAPYEHLVVGSGLYLGQWLEDAAEFLDSFSMNLGEKNVWLFSSGPSEELGLLKNSIIPPHIELLLKRFPVKDVAFFNTQISTKQLSFDDYLLLQGMQSLSADASSWQRIKNWGLSIATNLKPALVTGDIVPPSLLGVNPRN